MFRFETKILECVWPPHGKFQLGGPMLRKNQQLDTHEPIEFDKYLIEVGDFMRSTVQFRGIYRTYLK
jgi:hypothetical protein